MERNTPVRKPHTSTADLLVWSETPINDSPPPPSSATRSHQVSKVSQIIISHNISLLVNFINRFTPIAYQPSDGISKVVFGGQVTDEEVQSLNKR